MSVKALFLCTQKSKDDGVSGTALTFIATQGTSGQESKEFNDATPYGSLSMGIASGKPAADYFEEGQEYYLTFEKK